MPLRLIMLYLALRSYLYRNVEHLFAHFFHLAHTSYFCAVFIEAKGTYGLIAGGLFAASLIAMILHFDTD